MTEIIVKTQAELDAALASDDVDNNTHKIIIDSPAGVWITIGDDQGQDVWAWGSATVRASGSATVRASGSATVRAAPYVAVHLFSARAAVTGGVVIDIASLNQNDPRTWCELHGVMVDDDGNAHLYKAVDDNLTAGHSWTPTAYTLGSDPRCNEWLANNCCGFGLHICPTAWQARDHYSDATRYLEVTAPLASLRPIDATKCKAPTVHVLREVDLNMRPVKEATALVAGRESDCPECTEEVLDA